MNVRWVDQSMAFWFSLLTVSCCDSRVVIGNDDGVMNVSLVAVASLADGTAVATLEIHWSVFLLFF